MVAIRSGMCTVIPQAPGAHITVSTGTDTSFTSTSGSSGPRKPVDDDVTIVVLPETPDVAASVTVILI